MVVLATDLLSAFLPPGPNGLQGTQGIQGIQGISGVTPTIASQAQAEAGTDNTTVMTPLRTEEHMIANDVGQGQTWQTVTRTSGVVYQNTTGRPIMVSMFSNNTALTFAVSSDNVTFVNLGSTGTNVPSSFQAVIPNNHYYRGTGGIATATELR
jgi:hypothetical protein